MPSVEMREIDIRPLGGHVGAVADHDVDLRSIDDLSFAKLRQSLFERCVMVVRGQQLTPGEHLAFARRFGDIWTPPDLNMFRAGQVSGHLESHPQILCLANAGRARAIAERWHTDSAYVPQPPAISILVARELPDHGADTMFSNQMAAYDRLSATMKSLLGGLRIEFSSRSAARVFQLSNNDGPLVSGSYHPVVRTHPETGRKALYLSTPGVSCSHFEGMTPEESLPIIQYLYEFGHQPDLVYRHIWRPGDVVMWDNRICRHLAVHDHGDAPRLMHRVTIVGGVPV